MISVTKIKLCVVYGAKFGSKIAIKIEKKMFFWDILQFSIKYIKKIKKKSFSSILDNIFIFQVEKAAFQDIWAIFGSKIVIENC